MSNQSFFETDITILLQAIREGFQEVRKHGLPYSFD